MFNTNIITILKGANSITDKVVLKYPTTVINSSSGDIYMKVDMSILDKDEFQEIGVYDLSSFLSVFSLYSEDREVKQLGIGGAEITVSDSSSISTIITDEISLMNEHNKDPVMFERTKAFDTVCKFDLTKDIMKKIKTSSGVYKTLTDLNLVSQDNSLVLELAQNNVFSQRNSSHKILIDAELVKEFKIALPVVNFNSLPASNYELEVKYNQNANAYRVLLISKDIPGIEVIMSTNV